MSGPYGLDYALDNTPHWMYDNRTGAGPWCDPYGYESDMVVMGGVADPRHEQHAWYCRNKADGRYRMTCTAGHAGYMRLCYGHVYMISKRQNGVCPRCAFPPAFRELDETCQRLTREWFTIPPGGERVRVGRRIEELRQAMQELYERGEIRTGAPLILTEVS